VEAIVALYAPDAVLFPPDAMMAKGTDEIRKSYEFLNDFTVQSFEMLEANHEIQGNIAFSWGQFKASLQPKAGGEPMTMEGRFSDVSKKVGGKWLYIVDHASVPITPPSQTQTVPATK
jgi:ketosteroid isomerase-like protein